MQDEFSMGCKARGAALGTRLNAKCAARAQLGPVSAI